MSEIVVIGHKNPDTDAVCSAYCYAHLKNVLDPGHTYVPAVCGPLQAQAKFVFAAAGVQPPRHLKDIRPRVIDVARNDGMTLSVNDPIHLAIKELDEHTVSVVPVFSEGERFEGILGIHEMTRYFIAGNLQERPEYVFRNENLATVIPGRFHLRGDSEEFRAPIMIGAMTYESSVKRMEALLPEKPVLVIGLRSRIIEYAAGRQVPAIILTGLEADQKIGLDFSGYRGSVYISSVDTTETIRLLRLSVPVKHIMNPDPLTLPDDELFDTAKKTLLASEYRGLPVLKDGRFAGVVTRRSFIEKPAKKLILVDHNELSQSIGGAEDAEIREIIDHHRLGTEKTNTPIYVFAKPVGSTCTIVYSHFRMTGTDIPAPIALLLLAGLLSDTLVLKSPTTTEEDRRAAEDLARLAGVSVAEFGLRMQSQMAVLKNADPAQVVAADFKEYRESKHSVGIGQVEVASLDDLPEVKDRFLAALETLRVEKKLSWAVLLVTNVIMEQSVLLTTDFPDGERELEYAKIGENTYDLPGILSRKKQLLPEILRVLETLK